MYYNLFSSKEDITTINKIIIQNGKIELIDFEGEQNQEIIICNGSFNCDDDNFLIGSDLLFGLRTLENVNYYNTKFEYINLIIEDEEINILTDIRINTVINEVIAFDIFKTKPDNYIFITPSIVRANEKGNDYYRGVEVFNVLIFLHDREDLKQSENMKIAKEIADKIIAILFKDYTFLNYQYVLGTNNSTILKMEFSDDVIINREIFNDCYQLEFDNPQILEDCEVKF
jgi:hypothetical protein